MQYMQREDYKSSYRVANITTLRNFIIKLINTLTHKSLGISNKMHD